VRILYVNHTAEVSGGERSLLILLAGLPPEVEPLLACPPGPLQAAARDLGIPVTAIAGTAGSLRLHPVHTPKAIAEMSLAALQLARIARSHRADVVHANSIRAGIVLALAPLVPAARVVHVRDCLPAGGVSKATQRLIAARAHTVIANSRYTASTVAAAAPRARLQVIYNPVDLTRFDADAGDRARTRAGLGLAGTRRVLLGVLAQVSPWKGQDTAIEALRLLREERLDAHLLLIGSAKFVTRSTRYDNEAYVTELKRAISDAGLERRVSWLGEREDVPALLRALDILMLPSREEPFGRALIEAMAMSVPVLATAVGGPAEIIEDGREGYLLDPDDPAAWARAVRRIAESPDGGAAMGHAGRARVEQAFTVETHVRAVLDVYAKARG
jgi:glycosyltransferase involved in cell wall biosynthesis